MWSFAETIYPYAKRFCEEKVVAVEEGNYLPTSKSKELWLLLILLQTTRNSLQEVFYDCIVAEPVEIVEYLIPFVNPSADSNCALKKATVHSGNSIILVDMLIRVLNSTGALDSETCYFCLNKAIRFGKIEIVKRFLQEPIIDVNSRQSCDVYYTACLYYQYPIMHLLTSHGFKISRL